MSITHALEKFVDISDCEPGADSLIVDGSALVYSIQPTKGTFEEYAKTFDMHIEAFAQKHSRVDVIFDQYKTDSLKIHTRKLRGLGQIRKVTSIYNITSALVYATHKASSVSNKIARNAIVCTHEEADTRIFIHLNHAIQKDVIHTACIIANGTDVIIIAVSHFTQLKSLGLEQLWVSFGNGKRRRRIPIHDICAHMGPEKSKGLLFFHVFSGCDTVSGFRGKGKKYFLQTWNVLPDITETFAKPSRFQVSIRDTDI